MKFGKLVVYICVLIQCFNVIGMHGECSETSTSLEKLSRPITKEELAKLPAKSCCHYDINDENMRIMDAASMLRDLRFSCSEDARFFHDILAKRDREALRKACYGFFEQQAFYYSDTPEEYGGWSVDLSGTSLSDDKKEEYLRYLNSIITIYLEDDISFDFFLLWLAAHKAYDQSVKFKMSKCDETDSDLGELILYPSCKYEHKYLALPGFMQNEEKKQSGLVEVTVDYPSAPFHEFNHELLELLKIEASVYVLSLDYYFNRFTRELILSGANDSDIQKLFNRIKVTLLLEKTDNKEIADNEVRSLLENRGETYSLLQKFLIQSSENITNFLDDPANRALTFIVLLNALWGNDNKILRLTGIILHKGILYYYPYNDFHVAQSRKLPPRWSWRDSEDRHLSNIDLEAMFWEKTKLVPAEKALQLLLALGEKY